MPAATPPDRFQPSFFRFPIQNDRTGFQPVFLPVILVVPGRRDQHGFTLANSEVKDVRFFVADAPDPAIVAGPFIYTQSGPVINNVLVPSLNRFILNVPDFQLNDVYIDYKNVTFIGPDGNKHGFDQAVEGDVFEYTTVRGGITSTIPWFPDADYYDMSLFTIDVEDLPRPKRYHFVWECRFNRREQRSLVSSIGLGAFCINTSDIGLGQFSILINHPGEVHNEMYRKTPPFLFDNTNVSKLADDPVLEFYRPFADILQDIFDESTFINGINHIDKIPAQLIPYLAFLIGWDLPNFPGASDDIRRSILREAVRLQKLKGSRRAILELFDIFGFTIDLVNLWYSADGTLLIAPGEDLPVAEQADKIIQKTVQQVEPLVIDYSTAGFGEFKIPLLYRATGNFMVTAYLVMPGKSEDALTAIAENIENHPDATLAAQLASFDRSTLISMAEVDIDLITGKATGPVSSTAIPLINAIGVSYDQTTNVLSLTFDHYLDFADGSRLFVFATYPRTQLIIPPQIKNTRSNRFDVNILLKNGQVPSPLLLEFLLNFVFKLKSFHSLLRKIVFNIDIDEVYNVTDFCLGTNVSPASAAACGPGDENLTPEQIATRDTIYKGLVQEFQTWRALDGTHVSDPALEHFLGVPIQRPEGTTCQFTQYGQDRVLPDPNVDLDQVAVDPRQKLCEDPAVLPPFCFKGRVVGDLRTIINNRICEIVRSKPCPLGMGSGFYWLYTQDAESVLRDGFGHFTGQNSTSFLGSQIVAYGKPIPKSLHYTDRPYLIDQFQFDTDKLLAYRRPSLEIQKDNLGFPSHRFVSMANMKDDFTHPYWKAKPFDEEGNDLNAKLVDNSQGDQHLVYDDVPVFYKGNGILADISSLGLHEDRPFLVTHKVFLVVDKFSHPAIMLDERIVETLDPEITIDSSSEFGPIFKSWNDTCDKDFRGGYPAVTGRFHVNVHDFNAHRPNSGTDDLALALGVPVRGVTDASSISGLTALFTLGSQILVTPKDVEYGFYEPHRLDCDCGRFVCEGSADSDKDFTLSDVKVNVKSCALDLFRQPDGTFDYGLDQLIMTPKVVLQEEYDCCSFRLDGTIPNLLCILTPAGIPPGAAILPSGSFRFKDEYGTIFEGAWTFTKGVLDITTLTKQPYVWGEPRQGFVQGRLVFAKGIITTQRQVFIIGGGTYKVLVDIRDQHVDFFQTNLGCGDAPFVDNFCFHLNCRILDDVEGDVICGPHWAKVSDGGCVWPNLIVDSNGVVTGVQVPDGIQPFEFIDVWDNKDDPGVTAVCPTKTPVLNDDDVIVVNDGGAEVFAD